MKSFLKICLFMVALCYLVGGQWAMLQAIAWGKMLNDYSREQSFTVAVIQTFDGDHPCALCLSIQTHKAQEDPSPIAPLESMEKGVKCVASELTSAWNCLLPNSCSETLGFLQPPLLNRQWIQGPNAPPPKALA